MFTREQYQEYIAKLSQEEKDFLLMKAFELVELEYGPMLTIENIYHFIKE